MSTGVHDDPWRMFDKPEGDDLPPPGTVALTCIGGIGRILVPETEERRGADHAVDAVLDLLESSGAHLDGFEIIPNQTLRDAVLYRVDGARRSIFLRDETDEVRGFNRLYAILHRLNVISPGALGGIRLEAL